MKSQVRELGFVDKIVESLSSSGDASNCELINSLLELRCEIEQGAPRSAFFEFVKTHPEIHGIGTELLVRDVLDFVGRECNKYKEIGAQRPLTEAEWRYGHECLKPLLKSLHDLVSGKRGTPSQAGSEERIDRNGSSD